MHTQIRITDSRSVPSRLGLIAGLTLGLILIQASLASAATEVSHLELGNAAFAKQRYPQALAQYNRALEAGENRPMALFNMGNCLYLMKQTGRSLATYEKAISEAPGFSRPYLNAGGIYFSLDQIGLALSRYHRALELDQDNVGAIKMLGECYLKLGDKAQALFYFDRGRRADAANLDWYYAIAETYVKMQDYVSAEATLRQALEANPEAPALRFYLGELCQAAGENSKAATAYAKGLELEPGNTRVPFQLAALHEEMGNPFLALSILKEASENKAIRRESLMEMARVYCSMGQDGPGLDAFQKAAALGDGRAVAGMLNVGKKLFNQGELVRAKEIFARIKNAFPEDMEVSQVIADLGS